MATDGTSRRAGRRVAGTVAAPGRARPLSSRPPGGSSSPRTLAREGATTAGPRPRAVAAIRQVPAGKVIAVGLVCFGLWLMLDARQLYNSALSSPIGSRRSVAVALLRPIARVSEALSLDRPVNAANRVMGRCTGSSGGAAAAGSTGSSFACGLSGSSGGGFGGGIASPVGSGGGSRPVVPPLGGERTSTTTSSAGHPGTTTAHPGTTTAHPGTTTAHPGTTTAHPGTTLPARTSPTTTLPPHPGKHHATPPRAAPPPLAQPSPAHPITIVQIGDSLGEDLGDGLLNALGGKPSIRLETLARGDTGLVNLAYFNWPQALAAYLAEYHPAVVIAMFGGNDCQPFYENDTLEEPGTASFDAAYSARVADVMHEAIAAGAHIFWVGMPIMQDPTFSACMAELNRDDAAQAASNPGATFFSVWKLFEGPKGQYAEYLDVGGNLQQVRDDDGVHIDPPAGTDLIGNAVVAAMEAQYHIKL